MTMGTAIYQHLIGTVLSSLGFLVFAHGLFQKQKGKGFNPFPSFLLILLGITSHVFYGGVGFFSRTFFIITDLGAGMFIGGLYLLARGGQSRLLVVPGLLGLLIGGIGSGLTSLANSCGSWVFGEVKTEEILVELGPDDQLEEIAAILNRYGASSEKAFPGISLQEDENLAQYYLLTVNESHTENLLSELRFDGENVDQAAKNGSLSISEPENTPVAASGKKYAANDPLLERQWFADRLQYDRVYAMLEGVTPKKKMLVGIVDTGVDGGHEDLKSIFSNSSGNGDGHGHGTHCAGLAGAATNNAIGVGSLNLDGRFVKIAGFHALDKQGRGSDKTVAKGIVDAAQAGSDVISLSLGGMAPFGAPKVQIDAVKFALKKGAVVVVAAGNSNQDARFFAPANIEGVIVVAAVGQDLRKAPFSNTNTSLGMPIAAPGVDMMSSLPANTYQPFSGTSMATPLVAGLAGVMKSIRPELTAQQIYKLLQQTGQGGGDESKVGRVVQPAAAIGAVLPAVSAGL